MIKLYHISTRKSIVCNTYNRHYEKVGNNAPICIEDELPFDIPDSWEWCRMICIGNIVVGATPSTSKTEYWMNGTIPWLPSGCCQDGEVNNSFHSIKMISQEGYNSCSTTLMNPDTVLIALTGATAGKVGLLKFLACANQSVVGISPYYGVNSKFIFYQLMARRQEILSDCIGSAQPHISKDYITKMYFALPTLDEQMRIISHIEKINPLITEYDKLEQQKSKLDGEIYNKLKKSILQYAIQGKLVPQDENDEPASELLKRIRAEKKAQLGKKFVDSYIYKGDDNCYYEHIDEKAKDEAIEVPFDLPNNWEWARWGDLSYSIQYGYNAPAKERGRIKMVRISDINDNTVDWTNVPFCDIDEKDINTYLLKANDILFARTGGTVGKSYLVTIVPEDAIYAGYLIRTRYSNELSAQYLKYFMESSLYWAQLREGTIATAQPNCNGKTLSEMLLPIPPLAEQQRIVDKINEIFAKL